MVSNDKMNFQVSCDAAPCREANIYRSFRWEYCLYHQDLALPEEKNRHLQRHEKLYLARQ